MLRNAFFWKPDTHPLVMLLVNVEPYAFITVFSRKSDTPTALRNTWMVPYAKASIITGFVPVLENLESHGI